MLNFVISFFLIFVWFAFSMPAKRLAHFHTHASIFFWILFDSQSFKYDFQVQMHKWPCFVLDCIFHISFSAIFFPIWFNSKFISLWMSIYNFYLLLSFLLPNTCLLRKFWSYIKKTALNRSKDLYQIKYFCSQIGLEVSTFFSVQFFFKRRLILTFSIVRCLCILYTSKSNRCGISS